MSAWLAVPWMALVVSVAWRWRPSAHRGRHLGPPRVGRQWPPIGGPAERLGHWLRVRAGRPADSDRDRRLGWVIIVGLVLGLIEPVLAPLSVGIWLAGRWRAGRLARCRERRVLDDGPEVVDLFLLAIEAGCNPRLALRAVAVRCAGPWHEALGEVSGRVDHGERLSQSLDSLELRLGEVARPLVVTLLDAEHYGVPLVPALERLGRELVVERQRRAEERARRVPVQLLFPLVFCTLPAFVLLTVVPLLAGTLPTLST